MSSSVELQPAPSSFKSKVWKDFGFKVLYDAQGGTVTVLGNVTSLVLNVELGVFLILMLRRSHSQTFRHLRVPVPLSRCLYHLQYLVVVYFLCAAGFNIAEIVQLLPYNRTSSTAVASVANQTLTSLNASTGGNSSLTSLHNRQWRLHDGLINNGTL